MDLKLKETSVIWGSSESDDKMAAFWDPMSREELPNVMMEAAISSEPLYTSTTVYDIAFQQT